ncbi:MAG TPA: MFS transporter [Aliidongia sp.]|uniref:MFS transporter n=1 Tax=Aliidongia sp. TaxID=1914230 RepID=UPI002DDCBDC0|nr:MFS transporter [Aliidongia sp.]HEV2677000.1 MFS transporter [Aliidongia sp.]
MQASSSGTLPRPSLLGPLSNPTYRGIWIATLFSNFGVWIQSVAAAWAMTSIAPTVDFVAWVQAATSLPPLFFTLLGGVLADRVDQRLVFLAAQIIVLAVALALSGLQYLGLMTPWLLLGLTFALDSGSALRYPAYQTTIGEILPREQIPSALVLSSIGWNIARATGPALGGIIITFWGVPAAFAVNAVLNIYIILVLVRWRRRAKIVKEKRTASIASEIRGGFSYVLSAPAIRAAMLRCFVFTLFASALWSLLPLVAKNLVGGGPSTYGVMLGALGGGALVGASIIGWMRHSLGLRRLFAISTACFAVATAVLAFAASLWVLVPLLALGGLGWMIAMSTFNVVVQMAAHETYKGRAISVYYVALFGGLALGSWIWGHVAEQIDVRAGLAAAACGLVASLLLYRRPSRMDLHFAVPAEAD